MKRVYLDNAATTPLDKEVFDAMAPYMLEHFGNPSSIHGHGREVKSGIEQARKKIAGLLNASPSEIFFTSGGTEADNMAICSSVRTLGIKHIITSPVEHHAVLHSAEHLHHTGEAKLSLVKLDSSGMVDMNHLEELLKSNGRTLVTLMHGNNEIGNLLDLEAVGNLCEKYNAVFHTDTVQTMGHYPHDLSKLKVNFLVGSAHKFHGPKGVGFIYVNGKEKINPFIHGGAQERNMRGGTENVYGIIGMAKALEKCYNEMTEHENHIRLLKQRMTGKLLASIPDIAFNGASADPDKSLYTVLSASFPKSDISEMLLFNLDISNISASGGSDCTSGSDVGSHVIKALGNDPDRATVRFSFSRYNTTEEIDYAVEVLQKLYMKVPA